MAPTNRLIEARRAELRAEANADKRQTTKTANAASSAKRRAAAPKPRTKSKA
jgi:hypothetical protein